MINPWRYAGEYQDTTTGLYKMGARYYQPELGRWTQQDPSGLDANAYAYVGGNPVNLVDPTGLFSFGDLARVAAGAIVGVAAAGIVQGALTALFPALARFAPVIGGRIGGAIGGTIASGGSPETAILGCFGGSVAKGLAQIGFNGERIAKATQAVIKALRR